MKSFALFALACITLALPVPPLFSQADTIPSAAPVQPAGQTAEQRGRELIGEMVTALGGQAWLDRQNVQEQGRFATFFQGQPNGIITEFKLTRQFAGPSRPAAMRVGFLTERGMILPGKKIDVVQIWTNGTGSEVTYKGKTTLPKDQVEDFYRSRAHSIEAVVRDWINAPGVMIMDDGTSMVGRRMADKISILTADNDAVTLELDTNTHLPLRRTFQWRNTTYKDYDTDAEEYEDYHTIQGLPTPFTTTLYHNGEMASQTFLVDVKYNADLPPDTFNIQVLLKKK